MYPVHEVLLIHTHMHPHAHAHTHTHTRTHTGEDAPAGPMHAVHKVQLTAFFATNCFEKEKGQKYQCEV